MPANTPKIGSLTQATYLRLRQDLLGGILRPGDRLKVNELSLRYEVSLGAVREALARLSAEGLVIAEPQRGFRVAPISRAELQDLTMVRCRIEEMCLRRAIELGDLAWEAEIVAAFHRLSKTPPRRGAVDGEVARAGDGMVAPAVDGWDQGHASFHEALVAGCDSPWLLRLREQLYAQSHRYQRLSLSMTNPLRDSQGEHAALMDAVLGRDADLAARRMTEHLQRTAQIVLDACNVEWAEIPVSTSSRSHQYAGR
jgi:DNA-binding GntR family transcriptional regulator